MKVRSLALVAGLFTAATAQAASGASRSTLLTVSNDRDSARSSLAIAVGANAGIDAFDYVTEPADGRDTLHKHFPIAALAAGDGVVLEEGQGHKGVLLRGTVDAAKGHASLILRYLSNGLSNEYEDCKLDLVRSPSGAWSAVNAYTGKPVTEMRITTWALGISSIEGVCPASS